MDSLNLFLLFMAMLMLFLNVYLAIQVMHCPEKKCTVMDWVMEQEKFHGCRCIE